MSHKKEILKDVSLYVPASTLTQLISLIAAVVTRRLLGPLQTGVWAYLQVLLTYAAYTALGTPDAASRDIPYYRGKADAASAELTKNLAFTFALISSILVAAAVVLYAFVSKGTLEPELFYGYLFAAALVILMRVNNLLIALLRAYKQFTLTSKQMLISAMVNAVLIAALSYQFRIYGFLWAMILSFAFNIWYICRSYSFHFKWVIRAERLRQMIRFGLPLMLIGLVAAFFGTIDRLMVARYLGFEALGLYSTALLAASYVGNIPNSVGVILMPYFHEKYGEKESVQDLKRYLDKTSYLYSCAMPVLIGAVWFVSGPLVAWVLPEFTRSAGAIRLLILASYFMALDHPYTNFMISTKKHWILLPAISLACLAAWALVRGVIAAGWGIEGVAAAMTAAFSVKFIFTYALASSFVTSAPEAFWRFVKLGARFVWMSAGLLFLTNAAGDRADSFALAGVLTAVYFFISLPFIIAVEKETGLLKAWRLRW